MASILGFCYKIGAMVMQVKQVNQMIHKFLVSLMALLALMVVPLATMQPAAGSSYGTVQLSPSYSQTYSATVSVAPASSPTDVFQIFGSSSKTIKVLKVFFNGTRAGGDPYTQNLFLIKRSTAGSGGSSTTATNVPLDSSNNAATAVVKGFTANPTVGTTVGTILNARGQIQGITASTICPSPGIYNQCIFDADKYGQAVTLRGTAQGLTVNLNGVDFSGSPTEVNCTFVWTEE